MKDNTILLMCAVAGLTGMGSVAMFCHEMGIAYTAVGALAGLVGGHLNGKNQNEPVAVIPVQVVPITPP